MLETRKLNPPGSLEQAFSADIHEPEYAGCTAASAVLKGSISLALGSQEVWS